jgi:hypothetical protein
MERGRPAEWHAHNFLDYIRGLAAKFTPRLTHLSPPPAKRYAALCWTLAPRAFEECWNRLLSCEIIVLAMDSWR